METLDKRELKPYISGLKGIACLLIMICHYLGVYKYAESFLPAIPLLEPLRYSFLSDEQYWVYLFFVISGYLVAASTIRDFPELIKKMILRFLRFALPVLFSVLTIYLIGKLFGFHNAETKALFSCAYFQKEYYVGLDMRRVLLSPLEVLFQGDSSVNPPYWVLRDMFFGSCLIYFICWISHKWKDELSLALMIVATSVSFSLNKGVVASCLLGMLTFQVQDGDNYWNKRTCLSVVALGTCFCLRFLSTTVLSLIFFAALLLLLPRIRCLTNVLSSRPLKFLDDISWGVYSFHWPILCSIGSAVLLKTCAAYDLPSAYLISMGISCVLCMILALLFHLSFERMSSFLIRKIDLVLRQSISE